MFGVEPAKVQRYSGSRPTWRSISPSAKGDTIMGARPAAGGHLKTAAKREHHGKFFRSVATRAQDKRPNRSRRGAASWRAARNPKLLWCGGTAIPASSTSRASARVARRWRGPGGRPIAPHADYRGRRATVAGAVADVSTPPPTRPCADRAAAGSCAAPSTSGDRQGGVPRAQGGPHNQTTAGIAVALHECLGPTSSRTYAHAIAKMRAR